jgi:hypothetical protein
MLSSLVCALLLGVPISLMSTLEQSAWDQWKEQAKSCHPYPEEYVDFIYLWIGHLLEAAMYTPVTCLAMTVFHYLLRPSPPPAFFDDEKKKNLPMRSLKNRFVVVGMLLS